MIDRRRDSSAHARGNQRILDGGRALLIGGQTAAQDLQSEAEARSLGRSLAHSISFVLAAQAFAGHAYSNDIRCEMSGSSAGGIG